MRSSIRKYLSLFAFSSLLITGCVNHNEEDLYPSEPPCDTLNVTYAKSIDPIMQRSCNVCHNTIAASGGVVTDNYEGVKVIALNGTLWATVSWSSPLRMPQDGAQLPACDLSKINIWIRGGAKNN